MIIEINKDIDKYQETLALGLTARQLFFSLAAIALGSSIVFLLYPYIGLTLSAYVAIPIVSPVALSGFYSYNEMAFTEVMKRKFSLMFCNRTLTYRSTEHERVIEDYQKGQKKRSNKY